MFALLNMPGTIGKKRDGGKTPSSRRASNFSCVRFLAVRRHSRMNCYSAGVSTPGKIKLTRNSFAT